MAHADTALCVLPDVGSKAVFGARVACHRWDKEEPHLRQYPGDLIDRTYSRNSGDKVIDGCVRQRIQIPRARRSLRFRLLPELSSSPRSRRCR